MDDGGGGGLGSLPLAGKMPFDGGDERERERDRRSSQVGFHACSPSPVRFQAIFA